jgi:hypothetical protein
MLVMFDGGTVLIDHHDGEPGLRVRAWSLAALDAFRTFCPELGLVRDADEADGRPTLWAYAPARAVGLALARIAQAVPCSPLLDRVTTVQGQARAETMARVLGLLHAQEDREMRDIAQGKTPLTLPPSQVDVPFDPDAPPSPLRRHPGIGGGDDPAGLN